MAAPTVRKQKTTLSRKNPTARRVTKTADSKGRVVFGAAFANKHLIIEHISDTEVLVKLARVIPESEAWLYDNATALDSVRKGLAQARSGKFAESPDLDADAALAAELED